jgi:hypothetical protein
MGTGSSPTGRGRGPAEDALISRLRSLPAPPEPDPRFTGELRSQLVSIAPRLLAEAAEDGVAEPVPRPRRVTALRKPLLAVVGAAAVLVLLLGLAIQQSTGALPGQSLYGLKRAGEDFRLSVTGSSAERGLRYLKLATSRAGEAARLLDGTTATAGVASLVRSTLASADSETRDGMRLLGDAAVARRSTAPIGPVGAWAATQQEQLGTLLRYLPAGPARAQAQASLALVARVAARSSALSADLGCGCLSAARSDDLGPLPCTGCPPRHPDLPNPTHS